MLLIYLLLICSWVDQMQRHHTEQGTHTGVVVTLFLTAMVLDVFTATDTLLSMIGYLACCLVGIVPILTAAYTALRRRQVRPRW